MLKDVEFDQAVFESQDNIITLNGIRYKQVPYVGYQNYYAAEEGGLIWNAAKCFFPSQFNHSHINGKPYLGVHLHNNKTHDVHIVICETWRGLTPEGMSVDHKDQTPSNNNLSNLRFATFKEQTANSVNRIRDDKEYQMKMSAKGAKARSKPILCFNPDTMELIAKYPSAIGASLAIYGDKKKNSQISNSAHGKWNHLYGGFYWKLKDEEDVE